MFAFLPNAPRRHANVRFQRPLSPGGAILTDCPSLDAPFGQ